MIASKYPNNTITDDYIVGIGDIPIALVAHMDTVYPTPVKNLYYDQQKDVLWSPEGLGADDRAGIFAIMKILQKGLRPSVIFTTNEELGGIGATILGNQECPIPNLKYLIELDRAGKEDCVFYCCDNDNFVKYIEAFGFKKSIGSYSDIRFLMPAWDVCGVNLSIGYEDEHSVKERLYIEPLFQTIEKVINMLKETDIPTFAYIPEPEWHYCRKCKTIYYEYELLETTNKSGFVEYYCFDCIPENLKFCDKCDMAHTNKGKMCYRCERKVCTTTKKLNSKYQQ